MYDSAAVTYDEGAVLSASFSIQGAMRAREVSAMTRQSKIGLAIFGFALVAGLAVVRAQLMPPKQEQETERRVKEAEVPKAALETLKKHAGTHPIVEFSEEIEHGSRFYEGSWKADGGHVDVLVTETGDLVEIEEQVSAVPTAVMAAAERAAGKGAKMFFEKKTYIMYEIKYAKDGRRHEVLFSPDGRAHEHEDEQSGENEGDDD